jgi:hypothetical protein
VKACSEALLMRHVDGRTPVHVAAEVASAEVVEVLVKACPEALLVKENDGFTPLHIASCFASADVLEVLVKACPDALLEKENKGWTPVHTAAQFDNLAVVQYLAKSCPDALRVSTKHGELPLDVARKKNKAEVAAWLEEFMGRERPSSSPGEEAVATDDNCQRPVAAAVDPQGSPLSRGVHHATSAPGSQSRPVLGRAEGTTTPVDKASGPELHGAAATLGHGVNHPPEKCSTCRSRPIEQSSSNCHFCDFMRNQFDLLHKKIDSRNVTMDSVTAVLARMDLNSTPVPRLFILVPADKATAKNPKSWIKSCFTDKYYLYFVCAATYSVIKSPVKVRDPRGWFNRVAPLLALSLYAIKIGAKVGLSLDLDLEGTASDLLKLQILSEEIQGMLDACLREVVGAQRSPELLDRFKKNKLTQVDVEELYRDPYQLVAEEAQRQGQCAWRSSMEPVRKRSSAEILWVSKEVAEDPKYEYEIVRK